MPADIAIVLLFASPFAAPVLLARSWPMRCLVVAVLGATLAYVVATLTGPTDDGLEGLVVFALPIAAAAVSVLVTLMQSAADTRSGLSLTNAAAWRARSAALAVDIAIALAAAMWPMTALAHAHREVLAAVLGPTMSTAYFALLTWRWGATPGQWMAGLRVIDKRAGGRVAISTALARGALVSSEVGACLILVGWVVLAAESVAILRTGNSLTDRLTSTRVCGRPGWRPDNPGDASPIAS